MRLINNTKSDIVIKGEAILVSSVTAQSVSYPKLDCPGQRAKESNFDFQHHWYGGKTDNEVETGEIKYEEITIPEVSEEEVIDLVNNGQEEFGYELKVDGRNSIKTIVEKLAKIGLAIVISIGTKEPIKGAAKRA